MLSTVFTIIGALLLIYYLVIGLAFVFKASFLGSLVLGSFFYQGINTLFTKWWAWLIQLPFLLLYTIFIFKAGYQSIPYVALMQTLVFIILFSINRVKLR